MKLNTQVIRKINEYYTFCKYKYQAHTKAAEKYNSLYMYTTAPIIILSSITTILASYNGSPSSDYRWLALTVAVFSGTTTVCQSLASFLEFKNKYQEHFITATKYLALARMIENEFYINYYNCDPNDPDNKLNEAYIKNLFEKIYAEFLNIQSVAPGLPASISDKDFTHARFGIGEIDDVLIDMTDEGNVVNVPPPNTGIGIGIPLSSGSILRGTDTPIARLPVIVETLPPQPQPQPPQS